MKRGGTGGVALLSLMLVAGGAMTVRAEDEVIEQIKKFLTVSVFDGAFRVRLSGMIDLEDYQYEHPAPGLLYSASDNLQNGRLTLFLDAQSGSHMYGFAEVRVDRGFDPEDRSVQVRM